MRVIPGIELLAGEQRGLVHARRVGLLSHPAAVDATLRPAHELLAAAGAHVVRLFAPEHGAGGALQDMVGSQEQQDPLSGLDVVSLYGESIETLSPCPAAFEGLDVLVIDLVDVGARYYTYAASAVKCLEVAAKMGLQVVVADRPNPINGRAIEGNLVHAAQRSFVGELPLPNRHGMSLGEICRFAVREKGLELELDVVAAKGWERTAWADETGCPWVMPSPNMPTLDTATVYPGTCLVEGTLLSEGRGTTRPFEIVGAPWLDALRLARDLAREDLPGVRFRPLTFLPAFHKHAGRLCQGVQLHVVDREAFRPVESGLALIIASRAQDPEAFRWRSEAYEFVADQLAIDLLAGTPTWRQAIEGGASAREIASSWVAERKEFEVLRARAKLYP